MSFIVDPEFAKSTILVKKNLWREVYYTRVFMGTPYTVYMDVSKNRGTPKWMVYNGTPN